MKLLPDTIPILGALLEFYTDAVWQALSKSTRLYIVMITIAMIVLFVVIGNSIVVAITSVALGNSIPINDVILGIASTFFTMFLGIQLKTFRLDSVSSDIEDAHEEE